MKSTIERFLTQRADDCKALRQQLKVGPRSPGVSLSHGRAHDGAATLVGPGDASSERALREALAKLGESSVGWGGGGTVEEMLGKMLEVGHPTIHVDSIWLIKMLDLSS